MSNNVVPHKFIIDKTFRNKLNDHNSFLVWFTGLSGSGKSTIANRVEKKLADRAIHTFSLDGDNVRNRINKDLGFTAEDRHENLRRIGEISNLFIDAGIVVIASFISPLEEDREMIKDIVGSDNFAEIFVNTPLEVCEKRDVKGLYKKARKGEIKNFTGIDAPYENPENPDVEIFTEKETIEEATNRIVIYLKNKLETKK